MNYAIKAYGKTTVFKRKSEFRRHLTEWMAATEGSERDRAALALSNLERGIAFTDTDAQECVEDICPNCDAVITHAQGEGAFTCPDCGAKVAPCNECAWINSISGRDCGRCPQFSNNNKQQKGTSK